MNTTEDLKAALYKKYPGLTNSSVDALLQAYADEPSLGVPVNTGDGYLPTGVQDKVSRRRASAMTSALTSLLTEEQRDLRRQLHRGAEASPR